MEAKVDILAKPHPYIFFTLQLAALHELYMCVCVLQASVYVLCVCVCLVCVCVCLVCVCVLQVAIRQLPSSFIANILLVLTVALLSHTSGNCLYMH